MKQVGTASPFDIRIAQAPLQQQAGLEAFFAGMPSQDRGLLSPRAAGAGGRGSLRGGGSSGGSGNGSRVGRREVHGSWRSMSQYSDEVIGPSFWGAVKIIDTTRSVWNGGFGFACNAAGFLFGGSITMVFALFCILNLLNKMSVLAFLASFLPEAVLEAFVMNANMTAICPACDTCRNNM